MVRDLPSHAISISSLTHSPDPAQPIIPDAINDTHTGSARTMSLIRSWLTHCQTHHQTTCAPPSPVPPLPTRLIDVSPSNQPPNTAVLVETATLPPEERATATYLALSHCWGLHPPLTTTTVNLPSHLVSLPPFTPDTTTPLPSPTSTDIPLSTPLTPLAQTPQTPTLPPTFHHAILTTRALGHRYLWIDSLCILQDSRTDWAHEAARMGAYFAGCALVLAAVKSADSRGGLWTPREAWAWQPLKGVKVQMPGVGVVNREDGKGWAWYDWPAGEEVVRVGRVLAWKEAALVGWDGGGEGSGGEGGKGGRALALGEGPLDGGAWTMQELVLAQRTVRWEGFRVRWVCKGGEASENAPEMREVGEGLAEVAKGLGAGWARLLGDGGKVWEGVDRRELYMDWYRTVERYTVRGITKQFDILPAIGGLASRFRELVDDRYVAGLWEKDLHQGLLWMVEGPIRPGEQPFRAPSWSWASINLTSIKFDKIPQPKYHGGWNKDWCEIDEITTPLATINEYGEVDGGMLRVTGYLREFRLAGASVADKLYGIRKNVLLDPVTGESLGNIFLDYPRMSTDPTLSVWCLPVLHTGSAGGNLTSLCLALVPVDSGNGGQKYRRFGLATVTNRKWDHGFFPDSGKKRLCLI